MSDLVDGIGTNASFLSITSMALLPDKCILLADNARIRRLGSGALVSTFAGFQRGGFLDGDITNAIFGGELYLTANSVGEVYVADTSNRRIRKISTNGIVSTVAGSGNFGVVDGTGIFSSPGGEA